MSLKFMASESWRITYEGTMEWSEQTGQFGDHGRLFERVVSFEDIPNLEFSMKLSVPKDYKIAKQGPKFEIKAIKGGEMLDVDHGGFTIEICFSSDHESGDVLYSGRNKLLIQGYSKEGRDHRHFTGMSKHNRFADVFGHAICPKGDCKTHAIRVKNVKYTMEFKQLHLSKQVFQNASQSSLGKILSEKLFLSDEFSDVKILCEEKTFPCHRSILGSQSEVFKSMLSNANMDEASSGEIKITDMSANLMETLLCFLYFNHENGECKMANKHQITIDLLLAADKYKIHDLILICVNHLKGNLSKENVVDIMIKSYMISQIELFDVARRFVENCKSNNEVVEMRALDELKEMDQNLAFEMLAEAMFHRASSKSGNLGLQEVIQDLLKKQVLQPPRFLEAAPKPMPVLFQSPQMEGGSIMKQLPKKQCAVCKKEFDSRNDLFYHLEAFGHAI